MTLWVMDIRDDKPVAEFLDYAAARDYCLRENGALPDGEGSRYYIDRNYQPDNADIDVHPGRRELVAWRSGN